MTQDAILASLRRCAYRHSRVDYEAEDLLQDVLVLAIEKGRAITDPGFEAWARGAMRNHARFVARTAGRRRRREASWEAPCAAPQPLPRFSGAFLTTLPPALRIVAHLVNLELTRAEIMHLLGLRDAAFRQRLSGLRRAFKARGADVEFSATPLVSRHSGPARRALKQSLRTEAPRAFAIRDPDGMPVFFSRGDHSPGGHGN